MKEINITSGEYLNIYLKNIMNGIFIPFSEAMIQGDLLYPLFNEEFIEKRASIHSVKKESYIEKINDFLSIKDNINNTKLITLWFGKDAFCIINLLTCLVYLESNFYKGKVFVNLVDDYSNEILEKDIEITLGDFKNIYLKLMNKESIKTNYDFINNGLNDYLYITSDNNHILDYIKDNVGKLGYKDLMMNLLNMTYEYGLGDAQIKRMIEKVKENKIV